jgi:hypothetical protein
MYFWPKSYEYGEPDLVVILSGENKKALVGIEVKFHSGKHGTDANDQLKRYYRALQSGVHRSTFPNPAIKHFQGEFLGLIYLTQYAAEAEISDSLNELGDEKASLFHLKWEQVYGGGPHNSDKLRSKLSYSSDHFSGG